jgi:hypothetical protein
MKFLLPILVFFAALGAAKKPKPPPNIPIEYGPCYGTCEAVGLTRCVSKSSIPFSVSKSRLLSDIYVGALMGCIHSLCSNVYVCVYVWVTMLTWGIGSAGFKNVGMRCEVRSREDGRMCWRKMGGEYCV